MHASTNLTISSGGAAPPERWARPGRLVGLAVLVGLVASALALLAGPGRADAVTGITSGGSIVYVKDGDVWTTSPDGAVQRRLTTDGSTPAPDGTGDTRYITPSRSDSGDVLVAVRNQTVGLDKEGWVWVMNGQGQVVTKFTHEQFTVDADCMIDFAWYPRGLGEAEVSPDGTKVTYTAMWDVWHNNGQGFCDRMLVYWVYVADIDGANAVRIEGVGADGPLAWASWAGNSRLLMSISGGHELWYVDLPGSQAQRWVDNVADAASYGPNLRADKLVSHNLRSGASGELRLWSSNGGPPTAPTPRCDLSVTIGGGDGFSITPSWAPDGNALVWYEGDFTNPLDEPGEGLQVMAVGDLATTACPGGYVRQSLAPGGFEPHWGPAPMDPLPTLTVGDVRITEGDGGTAKAFFTVRLSAAAPDPVTVDYATKNGTATRPGDYKFTSGTLTFSPGQIYKTVGVTVSADTVDEGNETFSVKLTNPSGATIADGTGVGSILDDDPNSGAIDLAVGDVTLTEGHGGTAKAVFTVRLSKASTNTVTVNYATANGTATAPGDYTSTSGSLSFSPGQTFKTVSVTVKSDTADEANETFRVNLSSATNAGILDGQGFGTIRDDD